MENGFVDWKKGYRKSISAMDPLYIRKHTSGGQNYLLSAMDMAKVGGPLSVVKVCISMLCVKMGYRQVGGAPLSRFSHKFEHPKSTPYYLVFR